MLTIGDTFPRFDLKAVVATDPARAFTQVTSDTDAGKWKIVFFWPKDFTFVCPTEIAAFGKLNEDFNDRDAVVYGVSTDSEFVHLAWRQNHEDLKDLPFIDRRQCYARHIQEGIQVSDGLVLVRSATTRATCWSGPSRRPRATTSWSC